MTFDDEEHVLRIIDRIVACREGISSLWLVQKLYPELVVGNRLDCGLIYDRKHW